MKGFLRDLALRRGVAWGWHRHLFVLGILAPLLVLSFAVSSAVFAIVPGRDQVPSVVLAIIFGRVLVAVVSVPDPRHWFRAVVGEFGSVRRRYLSPTTTAVGAIVFMAVAFGLVLASDDLMVRTGALACLVAAVVLVATAPGTRVRPAPKVRTWPGQPAPGGTGMPGADPAPGSGSGVDAAAGGGDADPPGGADADPPTRLALDPIVAMKGALIRVRRDGSAGFVPLSHRRGYDAEATAVCDVPHGFEGHPRGDKVPSLGCSCGFYALPSLPRYLHRAPHVAVLQVDLSGRVIRHRHGWRAERQRVLEAAFRRRCRFCAHPADGFGAVDDETPSAAVEAGRIYVPVCAPHAERMQLELVSPADLASKLGTTVRWADPTPRRPA